MIKMNIVILLTGCIVPNTDDVLAIKDIQTRKKQYIDAINWYLTNTPYKVVFGENSGTDISNEISKDYLDRVEFITFESKPILPDRGKGYKEMEIIEACINESTFIENAQVVVKGTGRLILKNIMSLTRLMPRRNDYFIYSWMSTKKVMCDSRFFFCSPKFLREFVAEYKEKVHKRSNFEENLALCIASRNNVLYYFPVISCDIDGLGGGFGVRYNKTRFQYFKSSLICMLKHVLFSFGYWPKEFQHYE